MISEYFGENVFNKAQMKARLPQEIYDEVVCVEKNGAISPSRVQTLWPRQ